MAALPEINLRLLSEKVNGTMVFYWEYGDGVLQKVILAPTYDNANEEMRTKFTRDEYEADANKANSAAVEYLAKRLKISIEKANEIAAKLQDGGAIPPELTEDPEPDEAEAKKEEADA